MNMSKRIPQGTITTKGIDVSHYEPIVDWKQAWAMGKRFAFAKATDGVGSTDAKFALHRANSKAAGFIFGGYHFLRYSGWDPIRQAEFFLKVSGGVLAGELPLTLDVEWDNTTPKYRDGGQIDAAAADKALQCLEHLERATGMAPIVYTAASFFAGIPHPERFARFPLWIANYNVSAPMVPPPWTHWAFWQWTDHEAVPGTGKIDSNIFNGSLTDLQAMTKKP